MSQSQIPTIEDSPPPPALRLYTLGSAALVRADGEILLTPSKPLALLTYLHCAPGRSATREHLANLLWSESRSQRAGAALRTTLNRMRTAIGDPAPDDFRPEITLRVPIRSDRDSFLEALDRKDFAAAMGLYGGPFFPNYSDAGTVDFEHWVDLERARLQECFLRATESLVSRALDAGHAREAVRIALRVRVVTPDSEEGWRVLLRALLAAGDRVIAHGELEALGAWLNEQGRQPEPSTARLMAQVRAGAPETTETTPESPALLPDLVGREKQFSTLITAWRSVRDSGSRHLHLSGAAGLGKTRLLTDLARRLGEEGAPVASLRANPGERGVEYSFAGELARILATRSEAKGISPAAAAILVGLQPAIANQFPSARPVYQGSDLLHQRAQAIAELLAAVTEDHPLVLLLDDLHWLDPASRQIVEVVTGRLDRARVLLVTAARAGYMLTPDLSPGAELTLEPLTANQTEELLAGLGRFPDAEWGRRVSEALQHATGGSPLLVLEALTLARERDEIALAAGVWACRDLDLLLRQLSEQEVLGARLNELEPSERRVLLALAVAGTPLDQAALAQGCATGPEDAGELFLALECRVPALARWRDRAGARRDGRGRDCSLQQRGNRGSARGGRARALAERREEPDPSPSRGAAPDGRRRRGGAGRAIPGLRSGGQTTRRRSSISRDRA